MSIIFEQDKNVLKYVLHKLRSKKISIYRVGINAGMFMWQHSNDPGVLLGTFHGDFYCGQASAVMPSVTATSHSIYLIFCLRLITSANLTSLEISRVI